MRLPHHAGWCAACNRLVYYLPRCPDCNGALEKASRRKYRNTPTTVDGLRFDSVKEAKRWGELVMLQVAGEISDLKRQVSFRLTVNGVKICDYRADFTYLKGRRFVVEDVKSEITRKIEVYRLKKRLVLACYGIEISEV